MKTINQDQEDNYFDAEDEDKGKSDNSQYTGIQDY